jgi:DNA-binding MarR family transcriptional regulator
MNAHELARLSPSSLMDFVCNALENQDVRSVRDGFTQLQARFERKCTSTDGSRQFLEDFVQLAGRREFRKHHTSDPACRFVAQIEHLLDLANVRASSINKQEVLRQIIDSRERGWELINALSAGPKSGLTSADLAGRLNISPQNLTPLVTVFEAQGLVNRTRQGRFIFVTLTSHGHELTNAEVEVSHEAEASRSDPSASEKPRFMNDYIHGRKAFAA